MFVLLVCLSSQASVEPLAECSAQPAAGSIIQTTVDFSSCGSNLNLVVDRCKFENTAPPPRCQISARAIYLSAAASLTITDCTFTTFSANSSLIQIGTLKQLLIDTTTFASMLGVMILRCDSNMNCDQLWLFDVKFDSITQNSGEAMIWSSFSQTYADLLSLKSLNAPGFLYFPSIAADKTPTFRRLSCNMVDCSLALFRWPSGQSGGYCAMEGARFTNTKNAVPDSCALYYENCIFSGDSQNVSSIGMEGNAKVSFVACVFEGLDKGCYLNQGGGGDEGRVFCCRTKFTGCRIGADFGSRQNMELANCHFSGFTTCGIYVAGPMKVTRCAFYNPGAGATSGILGRCWDLSLESVCFGYQGTCLCGQAGEITINKLTNSWFAASQSSAFNGVTLAYGVAADGFGASKECSAATFDVNDASACRGFAFPPAPTPRKSLSPIVPIRTREQPTSAGQKPLTTRTPQRTAPPATRGRSAYQSVPPTLPRSALASPTPARSPCAMTQICNVLGYGMCYQYTNSPICERTPAATAPKSLTITPRPTLSVTKSPTNTQTSFVPRATASKSNGFAASSPRAPSQLFSLSAHVLQSAPFTASSLCTLSSLLTASTGFDATRKFTASSPFDQTVYLILSSHFTKSARFGPSSSFAASHSFTASDSFIESRSFVRTAAFDFSQPGDLSSLFTLSIILTRSSVLEQTYSFTATLTFTPSKVFRETDVFTASKKFGPTASFAASASLRKTISLIETLRFTPSFAFPTTVVTIPSIVLIGSRDLAPSGVMLRTFLFAFSRAADGTQGFSTSIDLAITNALTASVAFTPSLSFGPTPPFTPSLLFFSTVCFTQTLLFTRSFSLPSTAVAIPSVVLIGSNSIDSDILYPTKAFDISNSIGETHDVPASFRALASNSLTASDAFTLSLFFLLQLLLSRLPCYSLARPLLHKHFFSLHHLHFRQQW
jgi:hypothetical protein